MKEKSRTRMLIIKTPYWLGIVADALWAVGLFLPEVFRILIGDSEFEPDLRTRLIMGIGGIMMTGWTLLLLWAVRDPIKRRVVILLTAFPVVFGMLVIAIIGWINGIDTNIWIIVKTLVLIVSMTASYILACRVERF